MLSVRKFMNRFPDEDACRDYLFQVRWPRGFICTKCGEGQHSFISSRRLYECHNCGTQTSITSGTVMHRTKLPLRYWMLAFYWVASGELCSARRLAQTLHIQYRSALRLLRVVREAMYRADGPILNEFWKPLAPSESIVVRKAKTQMLLRAQSFLRKYYRSSYSRMRDDFYIEYRFRSKVYSPESTLIDLITSAATTIYTRNEYRLRYADSA
jgi:transposase-like protein